MWLPTDKTATNGANKEGGIFQLKIQNGKVSQRQADCPVRE